MEKRKRLLQCVRVDELGEKINDLLAELEEENDKDWEFEETVLACFIEFLLPDGNKFEDFMDDFQGDIRFNYNLKEKEVKPKIKALLKKYGCNFNLGDDKNGKAKII